MTPGASSHAADVDLIMWLVHGLMAVLFAGWGAYFLWVLWRFRQKRQPRANPEGAKGRLSFWVEAGVVGAEVALLVGLALPVWFRQTAAAPEGPEPLVVRVVAEQFLWNMHYPGPDGEFGQTSIDRIEPGINPIGLDRSSPFAADDVVTLNDLHLPVNRPVVIQLSSKDVIHSFGVNAMRVKQDAIPGLLSPIWFTPTELGQYEIACSQLCGIAHYRMRGLITVVPQNVFDAWIIDPANRRP